MKRICLLFVLLVTINIAFAQKQTCGSFKEGYFRITDEYATVYIERTKAFQKEIATDGTAVLLKIKWISDCVYTLELVKYINNPNNYPIHKQGILTVRIMDITNNSYYQEATSTEHSRTYTSEVKRISKEEMPK